MWRYCKNGDHLLWAIHARERNGESARRQPRLRLVPCYRIVAHGYRRRLPVLAKKNGAKLVIINHQNDLDPVADLVIQEGIGEVLSFAAGLNR